MKASIRDRDALLAVSPEALAAYARVAGWVLQERYRVHSDVYAGRDLPEIIIPRNQDLGDYASVVSTLIETFADVADQDELTVYRDLVTADRDVIRVRIAGDDDGNLTVEDGMNLLGGARDLLLSAACSLGQARPLYRTGANRQATELVRRIRLGQTERGSFVVVLLSPVVSVPMPTMFEGSDDRGVPFERRLTLRVVEALKAVRSATESDATGDGNLLAEAVENGVSANLCEALVRLIGPFPALDVSVAWARTRPMASARTAVQFRSRDAAVLKDVARSLRGRERRPEVRLIGFVARLKREGTEEGTVFLRASVDRQTASVAAFLERPDYERAIQAHRDRVRVALEGDLERIGQRWRLLNARLADVVSEDDPDLDREF